MEGIATTKHSFFNVNEVQHFKFHSNEVESKFHETERIISFK